MTDENHVAVVGVVAHRMYRLEGPNDDRSTERKPASEIAAAEETTHVCVLSVSAQKKWDELDVYQSGELDGDEVDCTHMF